MARNSPLAYACAGCGVQAVAVCTQCVGEGGGSLCRTCGEQHECGEETLLPIVNSPRVGQCGYAG
jgi:transcription elongation factor Elf1